MTEIVPGAPEIDTSRAHPARVYDYWLEGKDNFAADREVAQAMQQLLPETPQSAQDNRGFLTRAVEYLAREHGIRQFLDIGTGLPTSPNVHEVAQEVSPESRVVYVDNDPIVLVHARALLAGGPEGATAYIDADLRDPDKILAHAARVLDFERPIAVLTVAIFHFIADAEDPYGIAARLMARMPQGSALVLSHMTADGADDVAAEQVRGVWANGGVTLHMRDRTEVARFFEDLALVDPGVVPVHEWRAGASTHPWWWLWSGVGIKT